MVRYLAFDIEIARSFPSGTDDWKSFHPLGITCTAAYHGERQPEIWYGRSSGEQPAGQMSQAELVGLVEYLEEAVTSGFTLLTWNGLGFDFNVLAEESGLHSRCVNLALNHVDMMFHIFCLRGHTLGLDKAAKGMGLPGKPPGMSGELAPRYWAEGKWAVVLEYVAQDVRTTFDLAHLVEKHGEVRWVSERGTPQSIPLPGGWLNVQQALALPEPDISWMRSPRRREHFTAWLGIS